MLSLKTLPMVSGKLPAKSGLGNFSRKPGLAGSLTKKVVGSTFHQFGDSVSRSAGGERTDKIYGSISSAIKNKKPASDLKKKDERLDLLTNTND